MRAMANMDDMLGMGFSSSSNSSIGAAINAQKMQLNHGSAEPPHKSHHSRVPSARNTTSADLAAARQLVEKARAEAAERNEARVAKPLRNKYLYGRGGNGKGSHRRDESAAALDAATPPPPLLVITEEIAATAALVAEADLKHKSGNRTKRAAAAGKGTFWMQE